MTSCGLAGAINFKHATSCSRSSPAQAIAATWVKNCIWDGRRIVAAIGVWL